MKREKEQYFIVDLLKLLFSFCIVCLHTNLFVREYPTLYWYSSHVIWRIAVPFFFISSGYFFCKKVHSSNNPKKVLLTTLKRLFILLSFWLIVSLPLEINSLVLQGFTSYALVWELLRKLLFYPWGAMWYILAVMVADILLYPFLKRNSYKLPLFIGFLLFMFAIISNSYYFLIENTFLSNFVDWYLGFFLSSRNGLFVGFFYTAIANYLTIKKSFSKKTNIIMIAIGMFGLILEAYFIRRNHYVEDHSLFFSLLLIAPSLFELAKSYQMHVDGKKIRNLSIGIYVLHRPILGYLNYFFELESKVTSLEFFIIVLLLSISGSYLLQKINNKYVNKVIT